MAQKQIIELEALGRNAREEGESASSVLVEAEQARRRALEEEVDRVTSQLGRQAGESDRRVSELERAHRAAAAELTTKLQAAQVAAQVAATQRQDDDEARQELERKLQRARLVLP